MMPLTEECNGNHRLPPFPCVPEPLPCASEVPPIKGGVSLHLLAVHQPVAALANGRMRNEAQSTPFTGSVTWDLLQLWNPVAL